jgi:hypothetical protein
MTENVQTYIMIGGQQVDASLQPPQSSLQSAFKLNNKGKIIIDMQEAKKCARDMIRQARTSAFEKVDGRRGIAIDNEDAAEKLAVKNAAKKLRDAPSDPRIDSATTADELLTVVDTIIAEIEGV